jgi:hypothetical protein
VLAYQSPDRSLPKRGEENPSGLLVLSDMPPHAIVGGFGIELGPGFETEDDLVLEAAAKRSVRPSFAVVIKAR